MVSKSVSPYYLQRLCLKARDFLKKVYLMAIK